MEVLLQQLTNDSDPDDEDRSIVTMILTTIKKEKLK